MSTSVDRMSRLQNDFPTRKSSRMGPVSPIPELSPEGPLSPNPTKHKSVGEESRKDSLANPSEDSLLDTGDEPRNQSVLQSREQAFAHADIFDSNATSDLALGLVTIGLPKTVENLQPLHDNQAPGMENARLSLLATHADMAEVENEPEQRAGSPFPAKADSPSSTPSTPSSDRSKSRPGGLQRRLSSSLRRRSWMPSRSPSPRKYDDNEDSPKHSPTRSSLGLGAGRKDPDNVLEQTTIPRLPQRQPSFSTHFTPRLPKRPTSALIKDTPSEYKSQTWTESLKVNNRLPKSFSASQLTLPSLIPSRSGDKLSTLTQNDNMHLAFSAKSRAARKRDALWSAFRDLENACTKFQNKLSEKKGEIAHTALLSFLKEFESHASNFNLHPEDLERRTSILHKWWMALVEFLRSRMFSTVSGQSRSYIIDAISGIMDRPEWKQAPSPFTPCLRKRNSDATSASSNASTSENDFLSDSVQHNIRNQFTQCLLAQMSFVVEKMAFRTVPSLVGFCGKTCAFAFFFCSEIAHILIKLWKPSLDTLKRVMVENGLPWSSKVADMADKLSSALPSNLKIIRLSSLRESFDNIRKAPKYPPGTEKLDWNGAWVEKWSGKESDLFYAFARHWHLLQFEYLPEATKAERIIAAGGIFVQAQILVNLDATLLRNVPPPEQPPAQITASRFSITDITVAEGGQIATNVTFDDVLLADPDGGAPSLLLAANANPTFASSANADRNLADNRLIALLRDILNPRNNSTPRPVREIFAQTFADLLRGAAKRTSQFSRFANETLCDFLEEATVLLVRYEQTNGIRVSFLDWSFWFKAWKLQVESNEYHVQMRVYSLIYTLWPAIILEPARKMEICSEFLLERELFVNQFCNWAPVIRGFYMRLLCWRVAKVSEDVSEQDLKILGTLLDRLKEVFGTYLYARHDATLNGQQPPRTTPSGGQANRRFIIFKTSSVVTGRLPIQSFKSNTLPQNPPFRRFLMLERLCNKEKIGEDRPVSAVSFASSTASSSDVELQESPKRSFGGGLLRTIIGNSKQERTKSQSPSRGRASDRPPTSWPTNNNNNVDSSGYGGAGIGSDHPDQTADTGPAFQTYCFRFYLEMVDRRQAGPPAMQLQTPRLPYPAQFVLSSYLRYGTIIPPPVDGPSRPVPSRGTDDFSSNSATRQRITPPGASRTPVDMKALPGPVMPIKPTGATARAIPYCGRALAEWFLVVNEHHRFVEVRKAEGVPGNKWVETPLLGADSIPPHRDSR